MRAITRLVLLGGVWSCTGNIDIASPAGSPNGPPQISPAPPVDACATAPVAAPARLVRLSQVELQGTFAAVAGTLGSSSAATLEADTRLMGFSSNADQKASAAFVATLNVIAAPVAAQVVAQAQAAGTFASCTPGAAAAAPCAHDFLSAFATQAWSRPVSDAELSDLLDLYTLGRDVQTTATDLERLTQGLEWAVQSIVQSPNFIYRTELGTAVNGPQTLTPYEVASALSYAVIAQPPDATLLAAAASNSLQTGAQRVAQVDRLKAANPAAWRARQQLFALEWAEIDTNTPAWSKQATVYPLFSATLKSAIAQESATAVAAWLDDGSPMSEWYGGENAYINKDNAPLYGLTSTSDTFVKTPVPGQRRRGVLTNPGFLGTHADPDSSSPVLRGSAILRRFLCVNLPSVPANVPPLPPTSMSTAKTTRERFEMHVAAAACAACHNTIDPPGFTLENFDGIGAYRTQENSIPIDSSGALVGTPHTDQTLAGPEDLSAALLASPDAESCAATQTLRSLEGRLEVPASDACTLQKAAASLHASGSAWSAFEAIVNDDAYVTRTFVGGS